MHNCIMNMKPVLARHKMSLKLMIRDFLIHREIVICFAFNTIYVFVLFLTMDLMHVLQIYLTTYILASFSYGGYVS